MKILHTADLHLGSAMNSRLSPERRKERRVELFTTFESMANRAEIHGAKLFLISGDLFDTKKLAQRDIDRVIDIMESHPGLDFLYLSGNHEKNALLESGARLPDNLKLFGKDWTYYTYGEVTVAGRSEMTADMFKTLTVNRSKKTVVMLHGAIGDRSDEKTVGLKDAEGLGIDYIALGHYHAYDAHRVDDRCTAVYPGTPEGRGFDEYGVKGYVILDTDARLVEHRFYPASKRTVQLVEVDISSLLTRNEIQERVAEKMAEIPASDLVRVVLVGSRPQNLIIDKDSIHARYKDKYYYFEIKDDTRTEIDPEAYKYDKSLKGEFIRLCMSDTELSDEDREDVIRTGIFALLDEYIEI